MIHNPKSIDERFKSGGVCPTVFVSGYASLKPALWLACKCAEMLARRTEHQHTSFSVIAQSGTIGMAFATIYHEHMRKGYEPHKLGFYSRETDRKEHSEKKNPPSINGECIQLRCREKNTPRCEMTRTIIADHDALIIFGEDSPAEAEVLAAIRMKKMAFVCVTGKAGCAFMDSLWKKISKPEIDFLYAFECPEELSRLLDRQIYARSKRMIAI